MSPQLVIAAIADLLGIDPRANAKAFHAALDRQVALRDQEDPRAAAQLQADERLLDQAIKDGKITASSRQRWRNALRDDPKGARALIAALAPGIAADAERWRQETVKARPRAAQASAEQPGLINILQEIAGHATDNAGAPGVTTLDEFNAAIESDPQMHRAVWEITRGGSGLTPPPAQYFTYPDYEAPWDPKPRLVEHGDGTAHWETPPPDIDTLTTRGSIQGQSDFVWPSAVDNAGSPSDS